MERVLSGQDFLCFSGFLCLFFEFFTKIDEKEGVSCVFAKVLFKNFSYQRAPRFSLENPIFFAILCVFHAKKVFFNALCTILGSFLGF